MIRSVRASLVCVLAVSIAMVASPAVVVATTPSSVTIRTSMTSARIGQTPILSGVCSPSGSIGRRLVVMVKRPGKTYWSYSSNRTVYSRYGVASWQYKYYLRSGLARGTYRFQAVLPAVPGLPFTITGPTGTVTTYPPLYPEARSGIVSITVR